jgi:hypothetical protein
METKFTLTFDGTQLQSLYEVLDMARRACDVPVAKSALQFMDTIREEVDRVNKEASETQVQNE